VFRLALANQPAPAATNNPTICTAMTFTMVMDGKISSLSSAGSKNPSGHQLQAIPADRNGVMSA
jgi:hypothetical protein